VLWLSLVHCLKKGLIPWPVAQFFIYFKCHVLCVRFQLVQASNLLSSHIYYICMQMMRVSKFLLLLPVTINAARFMLDTKPDEGKPNIRCTVLIFQNQGWMQIKLVILLYWQLPFGLLGSISFFSLLY